MLQRVHNLEGDFKFTLYPQKFSNGAVTMQVMEWG